MGFQFNRQLNLLSSAIRGSIKHNKSKQISQPRLSRSSDFRSKTHRCPRSRQQLSAKDCDFLKSIGLKVRRYRN